MFKYITAIAFLILMTGCTERQVIDLNCEKGEVYYKWYHTYSIIITPSIEDTRNSLNQQGFYTDDNGSRMQCR